MGLREMAEKDLAVILEDAVFGFGWPVTLTDPSGASKPLTGYSNDISLVIDPDTGQAVIGENISAVLRISSIFADPAMTLPKGIADSGSKPWLCTFDDIGGVSATYKVQFSNPDQTLGIVVLRLELYKV